MIVLNMVCGYTAQPKYLLDPEKRYSVEEFWDSVRAQRLRGRQRTGLVQGARARGALPHSGRNLHALWRPCASRFILSSSCERETTCGRNFTEVGLKDWPLDNYQPLPFWKNSQVIEDEKAGYEYFAITFKEGLHTFADTMVMPWLSEVSEKDAVHGGVLINSLTARKLGLKTGDRIRLTSPAGSIEGVCAGDRRHSSAGVRSQQHPDAVRRNQRPGEGTRYALQPAADGIDAIYRQRHGWIGIDGAGPSGTGSSLGGGMASAKIAALGTTRKMLGFSRRTVEVEIDNATIADVLRQLPTLDGRTLYDNLVCDGRLRGDFAVVVDGLSLKADQLNRRLQGGEEVVTMAILRHLHGG